MGTSNTWLVGIFLVNCASSAWALPISGAQAEASALRVEDAVDLRKFGAFSPIQFSPDGRSLAYVIVESQRNRHVETEMQPRTGVPWFGQGCDVAVMNIETGEEQNLTGGKGNNWLPSWSHDGRYLAFLSDRDGSGRAKLWVWNAQERGLRKVSELPIDTDQLEWTRDGRGLILTTLREQLSGDEPGEGFNSDGSTTSIPKISNSTVTVYSSGGYQTGAQGSAQSDPWSLDRKVRNIVVLDVPSGRAETLVLNERVTSVALSPDGSQIAYLSPKRFEQPGSQQIVFDVIFMTLSSNQRRVVASAIRLDYSALSYSWSPDSRYFCFRTGGPLERANDVYVVESLDGKVQKISAFPEAKAETPHRSLRPLWDRSGRYVYLLRDGTLWRASLTEHRVVRIAGISDGQITQLIAESGRLVWAPEREESTIVLVHDDAEKEDEFYRINLADGRFSRVLKRSECYSCALEEQFVAVSNDGHWAAYFAEDAQHSQDLWLSNSSFQSPRRLTHLNPQFDKYRMGEMRLVNWLSDDGELLKGSLLLPSGYQEGKRYPLIVFVYGGSFLSNRLDRFGLAYFGPFNMQLFSTRGYAVLLPDSPQHIGTPMLDLVKTVLPGVSELVRLGIADPEKVGVMGHSNGGYGTLALLVQSKRFRAAVEVDGTGDLLGVYGEMRQDGSAYGTSVEHGQNALGGSPWEVRERFVENSPVFYLDRTDTPLLIVQGTDDTAVAPFLADEIFVGLRRLGKEAEYAKYAGEGHEPSYWSRPNQIDFCTRMLNWFEVHLRDRAQN